ncbi:MAG TPA: hypothetical protein VFM03_00110 [Candidatus Limnocylindria bacterium]|jgi:hypothetical protein|nr:hypothetical protein [Candidatus Limnocylindria bacterium]
MVPVVRLLVGVAAVAALLIGLLVLFTGSTDTAPAAVWLMVLGAVGLIGVTFERLRYRSEAAERAGESAGGPGVESGPPDPRFRPTEERFVDPTTRARLRVWIDPATGERRYRLDE